MRERQWSELDGDVHLLMKPLWGLVWSEVGEAICVV
jgi:hypothetical protein